MKKTLLACILVLCHSPVFAQSDTRLLGSLIAAWARVADASGLVSVEGIRASVREADPPVVEDLTVRLRWEGGAEHRIAFAPYEETREAAERIEGRADIERVTTLYTSHEAEDLDFEVQGFSNVTVSIDGENALSISRYRPSTGTGASRHLISRKSAGAGDLAIMTLWIGGNGSPNRRVEVRDPEGKVLIASVDRQLDAYPGQLAVVADYFEGFPFSNAGDYDVSVFLGGEVVLSCLLRVAAEK